MTTTFASDYGIVVLGGGSGIGRDTSRYLAACGARLMVTDREGDRAEQTAALIRTEGGEATALAVDVTDLDAMQDAMERLIAWNGRIHAVVNSAGVQGPLGKPSHEVAIAEFEATLRVNLTGGLVLTRAVLPHMLQYGYGRIVHVASIAGKEGNPHMVAYSASKAGLIGLVKTQGKEYAGTGVTVNAVAPAVIRTQFLDSQPQETLDYMLQRIPMGRPGTTDEVAALIAFAASEECSFTTGFTFDISGGRATY